MRKLGLAVALLGGLTAASLAVWQAMRRFDDASTATAGGPSAGVQPGADTPPETTPVRREIPKVDLSGETNLATARLQYMTAAHQFQVDPRTDGWDSEAVAEQVDAQLKLLASCIAQPKPGQLEKLDSLTAKGFACSPLRPADLAKVWEKHGVAVARSAAGAAKAPPVAGGLADEVAKAFGDFASAEGAGASFKTIRVENKEGVVSTVSYFQASRRGGGRTLQLNAKWNCRWRLTQQNQPPRLELIEVQDHEEIDASLPAGALFSDVTVAALGGNPCFEQQLRRGLNYWVQCVDFSYGSGIAERYGMAIGDVNGDGLEDVYICQPVGLPNKLLVQDGTGAVVDRSAEAGVDFLDHTTAALLVDLDNDGDPDLICSMFYHILILENDGQGRFAVQADVKVPEWDLEGLTAIDVDNDGDLDLFQCVGKAEVGKVPFVYYDARDGGPNFLFRNDISSSPPGEWKFTEIAHDVGLSRDNYRQSLAAAWEDFDNDGDSDLFIANDYGTKNLFRNDNGRFVDVAREAGVLDPGSGMSASWGDFDRDGHMDLYVGNMFSSAGNRITTQEQQLERLNPTVRALLQRFAKGNSLFRNKGDGTFEEVGLEAGVEIGRWAWSSLFADLNNDGWEDIYVANGFITNDKIDDL
ncbi:MAG: VCBS repeat-containing protein [Planctomycetia bacterium]|nr:VCBS repeat-containing protein [Planctomycetia bacterium]